MELVLRCVCGDGGGGDDDVAALTLTMECLPRLINDDDV